MKSLKPLIIFLFLIIIVVAGAGAYAYFMTDVFKTPKQLFTKYLESTVTEIANYNYKPLDEIMKQIENNKSETKIYLPSAEEPRVKAKLLTDPQNYYTSGAIEYIIEDTSDPIKVEFAGSKDEFGIKVEEIYDKYVALENRDLDKIAKNWGADIISDPENVPDKIPVADTKKNVETLKELYADYKEKFLAKFDEKECFTVEKDVNVSVGEKELIANKYTFKTTTKTLEANVTSILEELCNDTRFIELYKETYNEDPAKMLEKYKETLEDDEEDKNLNFSLYVTKEQATVKVELEAGDLYTSLEIEDRKITINSRETKEKFGEDYTVESKYALENNYSGTSGDIIITSSSKYDEYESNQKVTLSITNNNSEYNVKSKITIDDEEDDLIEFTTKIDENANIEKITSDNATVINDYTQEDLAKLFEEIMLNASNYVERKPDSSLSMLLMFFTGYPSYSGLEYEDMLEDELSEYDLGEYDLTTSDIDTISSDTNISKIKSELTTSIQSCLTKYQTAVQLDSSANIGDYLNVSNIQSGCTGYTIQLLEGGTTLKCTMNYDLTVYYAIMSFDGLNVKSVDVYTESEYREL